MKNIKNKTLYLLIFVLFFSYWPPVSAKELCSTNGYTIITINGMIANLQDAKNNKDAIYRKLPLTYKNQKIKVDYLHNETHIAGIGDFIDSANQKAFERLTTVESYDFVNMINDLNKKLKTQKVIFVAHSQGNFYANDIYNKIAGKEGGIPKKSIGIYGIASPADYVAGGGKYITSNTDGIINLVRLKGNLKVLKPNVEIKSPINKDNLYGHSLSKVYLKYEGDRIASEIVKSLSLLKNNNKQKSSEPCVSAIKITPLHKIYKALYFVADPISIGIKKGASAPFKVGNYIANVVGNIGSKAGKSLRNLIASVGNIKKLKDNLNPLTTIPKDVLVKTNLELNISDLKPKIEKEISKPKKIIEPKLTLKPEPKPEIEIKIEPKKVETAIPVVTKTIPTPKPVAHHGGGGASATPPDTTPPTITLNGNTPINLTLNNTYTDQGATAIDDIDGSISIVTTGSVDTSIVGIYTITYTATDSAGNISTSNRTINVNAPLPDLTINQNTTLTAGEYSYNNVTITNNAILTLEGDPLSTNIFKGVKINATNFTVDSGSSIIADGKGYKSGPGTSALPQSGGSYGGDGNSNTDNLKYGSAITPINLGSGGTGNQNGGGAIQIVVSNTLLNNGIISANGEANASGGSIYVTTKNLTGSGVYKSNGGNLYSNTIYYMPGGGGRILLKYQNSTFTGIAEAKGGCGNLGYPVCGTDGTVGFFDTINNDLYITSSWQFRNTDSPFNFHNIYISDGAQVSTESNINITAQNLNLNGSSMFTLSSSDTLNINNISIDGSSTVTFSGGENINTQVINISGNSTITVIPEQTLSISVPNLNIEAGSTITASYKGNKQGTGTGTLSYQGGSYGGLGEGNTSSTSIYGSATAPIDFGSGGGALQRSGGAIRIITTDTLDNNGIISSNGYTNSSGGSIYITTKNLSGTGTIKTNGGNLYTASGTFQLTGSGGRIAIYYESSTFTGTTESLGGCWNSGGSPSCAGDGTVGFFDTINNDLYITSSWQFRNTDSPFNFHNIYISDGAQVSTESNINITAQNLNIDGGSNLDLSGGEIFNVNNFNITGNSSVSVLPEKVLSITVPNLNIEAGSTISSDDKGLITGLGTPGVLSSSGSSYGGLGGGANAKPIYGSSIMPIDFGSGDGYKRGGGAIKLIVSGTLTNNGIVSSGVSINTNFVSGGSIYIKAGTITGVGIFQANGGGTTSSFGPIGGGGGRIALHYNNYSFNGTTSASTGPCAYSCNSGGGDGTIKLIDDTLVILSSQKQIQSFNFSSLSPKVVGAIDETNHNISLTVPFGTDLTNLTPTIVSSTNSSVSPLSDIVNNFTNPVTYTITAEDGSTVNYITTVTIPPDTTPPTIALNGNTPINLTLNDTYTDQGASAIDDRDGDISTSIITGGDTVDTTTLGIYTITYNVSDSAGNSALEVTRVVNVIADTTPPTITNYTFNGINNSITINPLNNPLTLILTSSENVNWMSVKIERVSDSSFYKIYQSGSTCVDGGNTCTKVWDGILSSGGLLQDGLYKLKVHIKDPSNNEFYDYLANTITIDTSL